MVQWTKALAFKPDKLSLIPGTHMLLSSDLGMGTSAQAHTNTHEKEGIKIQSTVIKLFK